MDTPRFTGFGGTADKLAEAIGFALWLPLSVAWLAVKSVLKTPIWLSIVAAGLYYWFCYNK